MKNWELSGDEISSLIETLQYICQRECRVGFERPCMHEDTLIDEPCESCAARMVLEAVGVSTLSTVSALRFPKG